jgi:hypothetical protein
VNTDSLKSDLVAAGGKMTVGPGVTLFGMMTLNDMALIAGILCSLVIFVHTALKMVWDWQDRQTKRAILLQRDPANE